MNSIPFWQVDSFTKTIFSGNPAGVSVLKEDLSDHLKQSIAAEMNLSETAFVLLNETPFNLRWFTPEIEVVLCGHATLAAAHILFEKKFIAGNDIQFMTKSGLLAVSKNDRSYTMQFPQRSIEEQKDLISVIEKCTGFKPIFSGITAEECVAIFETAEQIREMKPNFEAIKKLFGYGLIVSAPSDMPAYDFIYRTFFPQAGIPEDPVTGSAICSLGPYWREVLKKSEMQAFQASARTGELGVAVRDDHVFISGHALTVFETHLYL